MSVAALLAVVLSVDSGHAQTSKLASRNFTFSIAAEGVAGDISRWSPGVNEGKSMDFRRQLLSDQTRTRLVLWDTGITDAVATMPNGLAPSDPRPFSGGVRRLWPLNLINSGVAPADIKAMAVSHTHPDHIGMSRCFRRQCSTYRKPNTKWPAPITRPRFKPGHPVTKLEGTVTYSATAA